VEEVLAGVWAEILQLERVGRHDHFFDLGGHSLLGTLLLSQVRDLLHVHVPLRVLFDAPTLAEFARALPGHEASPGTTDRVARMLVKLGSMSPEEKRLALQERRAP
jgi:hypothetical protein